MLFSLYEKRTIVQIDTVSKVTNRSSIGDSRGCAAALFKLYKIWSAMAGIRADGKNAYGDFFLFAIQLIITAVLMTHPQCIIAVPSPLTSAVPTTMSVLK